MYLIKWMILMDIKEEDKLNFTFFKDQSVNYLDFTSMMNFYRSIRWADGVYCPFCKSEDIRKNGKVNEKFNEKNYIKIQKYKCQNCNKSFNDFSSTLFHNNKLYLSDIIFIFFNLHYLSYSDMSKMRGHNRKSISHMVKKINKFVDKYNDNLAIYCDGYYNLDDIEGKNRK